MTARINRKLLAGIVGGALLVLTLGSVGASAAAPVPYTGYVPYGYYGYAPYAYTGVVGAPSYFDPRYCGDGRVSIVKDQSGALINVCTSTGQRIYPIYPDYAPYAPYVVPGAPYTPVGYYSYVYHG